MQCAAVIPYSSDIIEPVDGLLNVVMLDMTVEDTDTNLRSEGGQRKATQADKAHLQFLSPHPQQSFQVEVYYARIDSR